MLKNLKFFTLILSVMLFLGCSESILPSPKIKKPFVVGISATYAPIAFKANDVIVGLEADFAHKLAHDLDRELQFKILPWEQLPLALKTGVIDIVMSGVSITAKRNQYALFSEPYMSISQMAVMREGNSAPMSINHGANSRIGYIYSTTGEALVKNVFHKASMKGYTSEKQGIAAVMNNEIDYFFDDAPSIWYYTAELSLKGIMGWYVPYTDEHLAWAFSPKNEHLRDEVNTILAQWKRDGELNRMIQKWVRVKVVTPNGQQPISFE
jgi:polar amino acid transport system substrate-binding protein